MPDPAPPPLVRTHYCGALRADEVDREVVVTGWVDSRRDHGGCIFVDLRDRDGIVQVVLDPQAGAEAHAAGGSVRSEWVLAVAGRVRSRAQAVNPKLQTGAIEIVAARLDVLAEARTPPFPLTDDANTAEDIRLRHRYLDLRRPRLQAAMRTRHRFNQVVRQTLDSLGFLEVETPTLIRSTPEGARDYVVPSRVSPGEFFALPQSPQLFKQLLMVAGLDRYFQIARCFRDEDLRAERQPEFTQVDLEMSFCRPAEVQDVVEQVLVNVWRTLLAIDLPRPFPRLAWDEAMRRFGSDAPDTRFGLELVDVTALMAGVGLRVFADAVAAGRVVKGINLTGVGELTRKDLDGLTEFAAIYGAKGLAWARVRADGSWQSPIAKFFADADRDAVARAMGLAPGDVAVFVADTPGVAHAALGQLRRHVARERGLVAANTHAFVWVTDFPMFEYDADARRHVAAHHPFTAPWPAHAATLASDPAGARAQAYDIVLNGVEIGGGSIRVHTEAMQRQVFAALGLGPDEAQAKFGFLLEALRYGAPPHGGLALGVDRIMMQICQTASIRDVIAFPKTQRQADLMCGAPAPLAAAQLAELGLAPRQPG